MQAADIPKNENHRLEALRNLKVLDSPDDPEFDAIVKAAALVCGMPISLISLVDEHRQWFKAITGLEGVREMPREVSFCAHVILEDDILEIKDACLDPRFADNPIVIGQPNIRFYAGAPLRLATGENIGSLCVIDSKPNHLTEHQRIILKHLAIAASRALENHKLRELEKEVLISKESLLQAANYTDSILQNTKEPIIALMLDGIITHWNAAAEKLFGYSSEDMLGQSISRLIPPAQNVAFELYVRNFQEHPEGLAYETQRLAKNGELIDVSVSLAALYNGAGSLIGATEIIHDIRTQNETKRLLAKNEAHYRALSDTSPHGVFSANLEGRCIYTNIRWQIIFGLTNEQSLAASWLDQVHPLDRELVYDEWQRSIAQSIEFDLEFRIRHRDGTIRYLHVRSRPIMDVNESILSIVGSVEDVTERRKTLDRLAKSEERLRSLYQSTPAMLQSVDAQGNLISVSDFWLQKHGYAREEVIGRHAAEFMTPESAEYAQDVVMPMLLESGFCADIAFKKIKKNGEIFEVVSSSYVERDLAGTAIRVMTVSEDVTAENAAKRATQELLSTINTQFITSIMDREGLIIDVNEAFCEISQYHRDELILESHKKLKSQRHTEEFYLDIWNTILSHQTWHGEICNCKKDGTLFWTDTVIAPLNDANGNIERFISIASDITMRKLTESALLEQENRTSQILENQSAATFIIDNQHCVTHWNRACELLTGIKQEDIIGSASWKGFYSSARSCLADLVLEGNLAQVDSFYSINRPSNLIPNGWHAEAWFDNLGGQRRYVTFDAAPIHDDDGKIVAVIETLQDNTESKAAELNLKEERQQLASVIEGTQAGTWEWNVATGVVRHNEYWAKMLGYHLSEIDEDFELWTKLLHPDDYKKCINAQLAHFSGLTEIYEVEFRMRHKMGHWVWILSRGRVLSWIDQDQPEWMFGTHVDITIRKQQEDALLRAKDKISIATSSGGIAIWSYDVVNDLLECDSTINSLYGLNVDEVLTLDLWVSMLHPDDREQTVNAFQDAIAGLRSYDVEFRAVWRDGTTHYIRARATITRDQDGNALNMLGTNWDVSALRELAIQISEQHETLRITMQSIGDAVITTDAEGKVTWLNPVAERMTGWISNEAKGIPLAQVFNIVHDVTRKSAKCPVSECLKLGKIVGLANNTVLISKAGVEYGIEDSASPIRAENGKVIGVVLVFHDVTEQRRLSSEMTYRATHDPLTGLINRAEFESELVQALNSAKTDGSEHSIMFIDLDQFKLVNDSCGHSAGDMLLQQVSKILLDIVRTSDFLARLGGDEFGVILRNCPVEQAERVAQSICDRLDEYRFVFDEKRFRVGTSIGLVVLDSRWPSISHALQAADTACYAAKEAGKNRVHVWFDSDSSVRAHQGKMQWATRLEIAIDEGQFELYAQCIYPVEPDVYLGSSVKIHAEILLRLKDENGEMISPAVFLPAAERFHLAARIDRWVLENVLLWLKSLDDTSSISTLCVNLSGQSIGDRAFHAYAIEILKQAGCELCALICVEITETATVTNMADASIFIQQIRQLGVRVALDDFGAGASSFGYLKNLKVDMLKIDGQYIKAMLSDPLDNSAVRCFVDVARILGLTTVAEQVENDETLRHVQALGISYAQGFLLHKPAPISDLVGRFTLKKAS